MLSELFKFLVDECTGKRLATLLVEAGYDALFVGDWAGVGMSLVEIKKQIDPSLGKKLLNKHRRLRENLLWILANKEQLRSTYANKYVAVENKSVKFSDATIEGILFEIQAAGRQAEDFAIEYIGKQPHNYLF